MKRDNGVSKYNDYFIWNRGLETAKVLETFNEDLDYKGFKIINNNGIYYLFRVKKYENEWYGVKISKTRMYKLGEALLIEGYNRFRNDALNILNKKIP